MPSIATGIWDITTHHAYINSCSGLSPLVSRRTLSLRILRRPSRRSFLLYRYLFGSFATEFLDIYQRRKAYVTTEDVLVYPVRRLAEPVADLLVRRHAKHGV